jgi:tetratricopeptide (TPR) repeat protein
MIIQTVALQHSFFSLSKTYYDLFDSVDKKIGYDSANPATMKEIAKGHMFKASLLSKLGDFESSLYKYHEAFQMLQSSLGFRKSQAIEGDDKDINLLIVCLYSMAQLFYRLGQLGKGYETINTVLRLVEELYDDHHPISVFFFKAAVFYDGQVSLVHPAQQTCRRTTALGDDNHIGVPAPVRALQPYREPVHPN